MNLEIISNHLKNISNINKRVKFALYVPNLCPNFPSIYTMTEIDKMLSVFVRYSLRTIFFFNKYFKEYETILNYVENNYGYERNLKIRISDDIYHYLDSAIISFKSISEQSVIDNSKLRSVKLQSTLLNVCCEWFKKINEIRLGDLRNEIVHLNEFGLSLYSWAQINASSKMVSIVYSDYINETIDQLSINKIFESALNCIDEIIGIILTDYFLIFGYPDLQKPYFLEKELDSIFISEYKIIL